MVLKEVILTEREIEVSSIKSVSDCL